jgi:hypothetical protein
MSPTTIRKGVPILALAIILAACGRTAADDGAAAPSASDRPAPSGPAQPPEQPSERPSEEPSDRPSEQPSDAPAPSQPPSSPSGEPEPSVVEHGVGIVGRVTGDGVAVRNLPDLDSSLVGGTLSGGGTLDEIRLRAGDEVLVLVGPVYADGYSWYEVMAGGRGPASYYRGWMAGEFLERVRDVPQVNAVAWADGQGFSASASGNVAEFSPLVVAHGVTPMPGDDSCTFELFLVGTDGQRVVLVPTQTVTDARIGQAAAGNLEELYMDAGGSIEVGATTDCAFAVTVTVPQG